MLRLCCFLFLRTAAYPEHIQLAFSLLDSPNQCHCDQVLSSGIPTLSEVTLLLSHTRSVQELPGPDGVAVLLSPCSHIIWSFRPDLQGSNTLTEGSCAGSGPPVAAALLVPQQEPMLNQGLNLQNWNCFHTQFEILNSALVFAAMNT